MFKALCERPFTLHCQKPEQNKKNVDVAIPLEKFLRRPMVSSKTVYIFDQGFNEVKKDLQEMD